MAIVCPTCSKSNPDGAVVCVSCSTPLGPSLSAAVGALPAGTRLRGGTYTVGRMLGRGGFAITYLGSDAKLNRTVAVKEYFPQLGCMRSGRSVVPTVHGDIKTHRESLQRFLQEAQTVARFQHPSIVPVHDAFEENATAYVVMAYLKGKPLQAIIETRGKVPEAELLDYIAGIGEALTQLHAQDLIHRDIKPDNIIITDDGHAVLIDFGAARNFAAGKTSRMSRILTPGYAPLEQYAENAHFGPMTDVYALGATMYHALTGSIPSTPFDRLNGVALTSPADLEPTVSKPVSDAIMWALEVKDLERPHDVHTFLGALAGRAAQKGRRTFSRSVASAGNGLAFRKGEATTVAELADLLDRYPNEAQDYLFANKRLGEWLARVLGEVALEVEAQEIVKKYSSKREIGLELFARQLRARAGQVADPELEATPTGIDFGSMPQGAQQSATVHVRNRTRGKAWGGITVVGHLPGVTVTSSYSAVPFTLQVDLDTGKVGAGSYQGDIQVTVEGAATALTIPVKFVITPIRVKVSPTAQSFGTMSYGATRSERLVLAVTPAGGRLKGVVTVRGADGVTVVPHFEDTPPFVLVAVNSDACDAGRTYSGTVELRTNGGDIDVPIRFTVLPALGPIFGFTLGGAAIVGGALGLVRLALASAGNGLEAWLLSWPSGNALRAPTAWFGLVIVIVIGISGAALKGASGGK